MTKKIIDEKINLKYALNTDSNKKDNKMHAKDVTRLMKLAGIQKKLEDGDNSDDIDFQGAFSENSKDNDFAFLHELEEAKKRDLDGDGDIDSDDWKIARDRAIKKAMKKNSVKEDYTDADRAADEEAEREYKRNMVYLHSELKKYNPRDLLEIANTRLGTAIAEQLADIMGYDFSWGTWKGEKIQQPLNEQNPNALRYIMEFLYEKGENEVAQEIENYLSKNKMIEEILKDAVISQVHSRGKSAEKIKQEYHDALKNGNEELANLIKTIYRMRFKQQIDEVAPKGWEGTVKAMKKDKNITNPWALAYWMKKKGYKSHQKEEIEEMARILKLSGIKINEDIANVDDEIIDQIMTLWSDNQYHYSEEDIAKKLNLDLDTVKDIINQLEKDEEEYYDYMSDVEADADTLASAGWGTDEDYGYYGESEELDEKWPGKPKVKSLDKWGDYTVAELKKKANALKKKEKRTAAETKQLRQINFAIRAKTGWGKIKEEELNENTRHEFYTNLSPYGKVKVIWEPMASEPSAGLIGDYEFGVYDPITDEELELNKEQFDKIDNQIYNRYEKLYDDKLDFDTDKNGIKNKREYLADDEDLDDPYEMGRQTRVRGESLLNNPFNSDDPIKWKEWRKGWLDEDIILRTGGKDLIDLAIQEYKDRMTNGRYDPDNLLNIMSYKYNNILQTRLTDEEFKQKMIDKLENVNEGEAIDIFYEHQDSKYLADDEEEFNPYEEGRSARIKGLPILDNPYKINDDYYDEWLEWKRGWIYEDRILRTGGKEDLDMAIQEYEERMMKGQYDPHNLLLTMARKYNYKPVSGMDDDQFIKRMLDKINEIHEGEVIQGPWKHNNKKLPDSAEIMDMFYEYQDPKYFGDDTVDVIMKVAHRLSDEYDISEDEGYHLINKALEDAGGIFPEDNLMTKRYDESKLFPIGSLSRYMVEMIVDEMKKGKSAKIISEELSFNYDDVSYIVNFMKKRLTEKKWIKTNPKEKGKYEGKTLADLKKMREDLKKDDKKYKDQGKKVPQKNREKMAELNFAIRAKEGHGFSKK